MAKKTYGYLFQKVVDQTSLNNTFNDGTATTRLIKTVFSDTEIQARTETEGYDIETSVDVTTVAGQNNYAMPTGSDRVKKLFVLIGNRRYYLNADRLLWDIAFDRLLNFPTVASDIPQYWSIQKNEILIFPKPAAGGYTMTIYYSPISTTINVDPSNNSDVNTSCNIKEWFEDILFFRGVEAIFRQREQDNQAAIWEKKATDKFAEFWNKVANPTPSSLIKYGRGRFANPNLYPYNMTKT